MKTENLTNTYIEKVICPQDKKDIYIQDAKVSSLFLRVMSNNSKYFWIKKQVNGNRVRKSIGIYPQMKIEVARKMAIEFLANLDDYIQEKTSPISKKITVRELFNYYMINHAEKNLRPETIKFYKNAFKLIEQWELVDKPANEITKLDVVKFVSQDEFKQQARTESRILDTLRAIYNRGIEWEIISNNPTTKTQKKPINQRDRVLSLDEIELLFKDGIYTETNPYLKFYFAMMFLVPARASNTLEMKWTDIDFQEKTWFISGEETKNHKNHLIPLTDRAIALLTKLKAIQANNLYVFPSMVKQNSPIINPKKAWYNLLTRANVNEVWMHDVRRTIATFMSKTGANEFTIAKALDHISSLRVTAIYVRPDIDDVRIGLEKAQDLMFSKFRIEEIL